MYAILKLLAAKLHVRFVDQRSGLECMIRPFFSEMPGRDTAQLIVKRGDQLVSVEIDVPAGDPELQKFAEGWNAPGNPRADLGV